MKWRRLFLAVCSVALAVWLCLTLGIFGKQDEAPLRIGATYMTMNNPFYSVIDEELRLMIESRGDILLTRDPALDQDKQNDQIHELLAGGIDLLVINPVDFQQIRPALEEARDAGVPVVIVDSQVKRSRAGCLHHCFGQLRSGRIVRRASDAHARFRTQSPCWSIQPPNPRSTASKAFAIPLPTSRNIKIAGRASSAGQLELAMPALDSLLDADPDIDVVMALNDPTALGAMGRAGRAAAAGSDTGLRRGWLPGSQKHDFRGRHDSNGCPIPHSDRTDDRTGHLSDPVRRGV